MLWARANCTEACIVHKLFVLAKSLFLTKHCHTSALDEDLTLSLCVWFYFVKFVNIACTSAGLRGRTTKKARLSVSLCLRLPGDKISKDHAGSYYPGDKE